MRALALVFVLLFTPVAHASGVERLKAFARSTTSLEAQFTQTVIDRNGRVTQEASGKMAFSRPNRFRWDYQKPYEQVIVGDGSRLWLYDPDLDQVTVRPLAEAIAGSPAALLAGDNAIERHFTLRPAGASGGLEWLEARPKSRDATFERVRMAFRGDTLAEMELYDHFGQRTRLRFSGLVRNPVLPPARFTFAAPKGADIVGD